MDQIPYSEGLRHCCGDKRLPERGVEGIVGCGGPDGTKPSHGLPVELACLGVVSLLLEVEHLHAQGGVLDCGLVLLWPVKLALLLETRACVALTQGLEGRPMLGELLRDT